MMMHCKTARPLLTAYGDSELDLPLTVALEAHLSECPDCTRALQGQRALSRAIRAHAPYFRMQGDLRARLQASLPVEVRGANNPALPTAPAATPRTRRNQEMTRWLMPLAAALVLGVGVNQFTVLNGADDSLADELVASHIRSLQVGHLDDVASTDQHTVKPWFAGKLDYTLPVHDLATAGFPLSGGRLDYVDKRDVAALDYRRRQHVINVFVWPSQHESDGKLGAQICDTYNVEHWRMNGLEWWAVSDLNRTELHDFAELLQKAEYTEPVNAKPPASAPTS